MDVCLFNINKHQDIIYIIIYVKNRFMLNMFLLKILSKSLLRLKDHNNFVKGIQDLLPNTI